MLRTAQAAMMLAAAGALTERPHQRVYRVSDPTDWDRPDATFENVEAERAERARLAAVKSAADQAAIAKAAAKRARKQAKRLADLHNSQQST